MRKRISIFILLIILVNIFGQCIAVNAQAENNLSQQEMFCLENDFFCSEEYSSDKKVSRGEFTQILAQIAGLEVVSVEQDKWSDYVYEGTIKPSSGTIFRDVDTSHPYYSSIKAVVEAGYMSGISKNVFAPDVNLTAKQAYTIFLDLINYSKIAEVEGGYTRLAGNLGITKGVAAAENDYLSFKELAKIIYNMLEVESYNYFGNDTKTFMNDVLKMKVVKGYLTDNGYTSLTGESEVGSDYIKVGDVVVALSSSDEHMRDYLGRQVKLYYKYDDADADNNVAAYMVADSRTEVYTFRGSDFLDYTGNSIKYRQDEREKSVNLSKVQYMIYNNQALGVFDKETFKINSGDITVIPESIDGKTLIIINSVEYAYVDSVDYEKLEIQNSLRNFETILNLNDYKKVTIVSQTGEEKTLTDILAGNVLEVIRNNNQIKITIVSKSEKNFYVSKIADNDLNTQTVYGDNKSYDITSQYYTTPNKIIIELNKYYDLYLNSKNEIVWIEARTGDYQVGYLIKAAVLEDTMITRAVICDMEGRVNEYYCDEAFVINDTTGKRNKNMSEEKINQLLSNVKDLVRFKVNKDGLISYLELPMDTLPESEDRLYKIADADDQSKWEGTRYPYQRGSVGFGGRIGVIANVKVLKIPNSANINDYKKYRKTTLAESFVGKDNSRRFIAYTTKRNNFAAEYIIAKSYENEVAQIKDGRSFFAVDKVVNEVLDDEGTVGVRVTGFLIYGTKSDVAKKEMTLYCEEANIDIVNNMPDLYHSEDNNGDLRTYALTSGDIIRLDYDEANYIEVAELVFRPSLTNPASPNGAKGALAGSIGYYDANSEYSNPVVIDENGALKKGNARYIVGTDFRLAMSWVNAKVEDVYQVTTQDLSVNEFDPAGEGGKYMVDVFTATATSMVLVEYDGGKVSQIRAATAQDIKAYEDVGPKCSRIIHNWYWGTGLHGFVINGL